MRPPGGCNGEIDTTCAACSTPTCPSQQYISPCTETADAFCIPCTPCGANQYISTACAAFVDNTCGTCSECDPRDEYLISACSTFANTVCGTCNHARTCSAGQQFVNCTATADSECVACPACGPDEYLTGESSRFDPQGGCQCTPCALEQEGAYRSGGCTGAQDTVFTTCTRCATGSFVETDCNNTHDTVCRSCQTCALGEYESGACSRRADRSCAPCSDCYSFQVPAPALLLLPSHCQRSLTEERDGVPDQVCARVSSTSRASAGSWAAC